MKLKILYIVPLLFLFSCGDNARPVELSPETKILYLGNGTEPKDLDPHTVTGVPESKILMALIEGLVIRHPEGKDPLPGIAKDWDISLGGKEYTFYLRDALWSNGDPVTANDFVYAWKRMLLPSLGSQYPDMLYDIVNAEEFNKGLITDFSLVGVKAIDDKTLKVTLNNPAPYFIELLAHYTTRPVHQPTIEKHGEIDSLGNQWTRPGNFVGNGPFTLEEWKLNQVIKVKKNPLYWDADRVKLNEIHFLPIDNVSREDFMFRSGQIHVTSSIPTEKIEVYKEEYPKKKVCMIFQPHRFSRTAQLFDDFVKVLNRTDSLILLDIYSASEKPIRGIHSRTILESIKQLGHKDVTYLKNHKDVINLLNQKKDSFDILVTQGAGSVSKVCKSIRDKWKA